VMTHRQRLQALLTGRMPDRLPLSFWRHFYNRESSARDLAAAMLEFEARFDWDLMKINPRAAYHLEGWGNRYQYSGSPLEKPIRLEYAISAVSDWKKIICLKPESTPALAEQIEAVRIIKDSSDKDLPIFMTVFNPLSIAGDLVENDAALIQQIRTEPTRVEEALENITATFVDFCRQILALGIDGIFLATTQWASADLLSAEEYHRYGRKYDLKLLQAITPLTKTNILHVCSSAIRLELFADYPVQIVNWAMNDQTNPDAEQGSKLFPDKIIMGGIDRKLLANAGGEDKIMQAVEYYLKFSQRGRFMLGPDCALPVETPDERLHQIKKMVEQSACQ